MLIPMTTKLTKQTSSDGHFSSGSDVARDQVALDDVSIRAILHKGTVGTLALSREAQPAIYNGLFVYDDVQHAIYFHDAYSMVVSESMEKACLGVSVEETAIVVYGSGSLMTEASESKHALELLLAKYLIHSHLMEDLENISPYRIQIERWSGKHNSGSAARETRHLGGLIPTERRSREIDAEQSTVLHFTRL